jgi:hypothetical protein
MEPTAATRVLEAYVRRTIRMQTEGYAPIVRHAFCSSNVIDELDRMQLRRSHEGGRGVGRPLRKDWEACRLSAWRVCLAISIALTECFAVQ